MSDFFQKLQESYKAFLTKGNPSEQITTYKEGDQLVVKDDDDGSVVVSTSGFVGTYIDLDNRIKSDEEYINLVRNLSQEPEFSYAIQEIVNELFVIDEDETPVKIDLESTQLPESIKKKIMTEFDNILTMLNFNSRGYDIAWQWYVDGKLYYHKIVDEKNLRKGIVELRNIDPRRIKKVKVIDKQANRDGVEMMKSETEFYIFNSSGKSSNSGVKIHPDNICYVHSGLKHASTGNVISHLHKAIKRYNQLRLLEESVIIYRFSRAPERRVFYVDVGNMPPKKGEKHIEDLIRRHRNKVVYNVSDGTIQDQKKYTSLLEDYWFPRNSNGSGTKVETLSGSQLSNGMEDVNEFRKQFYLALNVPLSRLEPETGFSLGRASEISREEVKFARFCTRLRVRFSDLFDDLLQTQLLLKNIIGKDDWDSIKQKVKYRYNVDTHFKELLDQEVLQSRLRILQDIQEFTPRAFHDASFPLFSVDWVRKHVLLQTENQISDIKAESEKEMEEIERLGALKRNKEGGIYSSELQNQIHAQDVNGNTEPEQNQEQPNQNNLN